MNKTSELIQQFESSVESNTSLTIKYLVSEGDTIYSWNGTELTTTSLNYSELTGNDFLNFGFDEISQSLCDILKSYTTFKILYWQDDIEKAVPVITGIITGNVIENPTLIFDVDLSDAVAPIQLVTAVFDGSPLLAFSVDSGITWQGYDVNNGWIDGNMYLFNCHLLTEPVMRDLIGQNKHFKVRIILTENSEFTNLKFTYKEE